MATITKNCWTCYHWDRERAHKGGPGQFEGKKCSHCLLNMWARFDDDKCENWKQRKPIPRRLRQKSPEIPGNV